MKLLTDSGLHQSPSNRLLVLGLIWLAGTTKAFYLSQWEPNTWAKGDKVDLWFNKIFSDENQVPYSYSELHFTCDADSSGKSARLNLGELFRGDRIVKSSMEIEALAKPECKILCKKEVPAHHVARIRDFIFNDYKVEWIVDDLPSGTGAELEVADDSTSPPRSQLNVGFQLGSVSDRGTDNARYILNNHFEIYIRYEPVHQEDDSMVDAASETSEERVMITSFEVLPSSIKSGCPSSPNGSKADEPLQLPSDDGTPVDVEYTYTVNWVKDEELKWSQRWDRYIEKSSPSAHWYSIINSIMLLVFLTVIVAIIILRTLNHDISIYNETDHIEDQEEVLGWKLVHGDVFRSPKNLMLLTVLLGSGVQIFVAAVSAIGFSILGLLSPSYRGGLFQFSIVFFALAGLYGAYQGSRVYKSFGGISWRTNAFWTATVIPLFLFFTICIINTVNWVQGSSNALPAGTFVALLALWIFVSLPLVMLGAYFGFKKQPIAHPVRTNQIPRQIPQQGVYFRTIPSILIGGVMPFAVIFIELFFVFQSMWQDQYYYMFGFLAVVFLLLIITCIEITIVMVYFQLCGEDYRWQWKSFLISSSSTWYVLLFAVYFYMNRFWKQEHGPTHMMVGGVIFFGYLLMGLAVYFVCTGMLGFFSCYYFVRRIYGAVKID